MGNSGQYAKDLLPIYLVRGVPTTQALQDLLTNEGLYQKFRIRLGTPYKCSARGADVVDCLYFVPQGFRQEQVRDEICKALAGADMKSDEADSAAESEKVRHYITQRRMEAQQAKG